MAVHFQDPPAASVQALEAALPRIAAGGSQPSGSRILSVATGSPGARPPGPPTSGVGIGAITRAAPVHVIGLSDLSANREIATSQPRLWAHLLDDSAGSGASVIADVDAQQNRFMSISEGAAVSSLGRRIGSAVTQMAQANEEYDLALIRVPALSLSAVWLRGRRGQPDIVIPDDSPKSPLTAGRHYTLDEFKAALKPVADQLLRETDPLKGG
jgi:hypothetical protein